MARYRAKPLYMIWFMRRSKRRFWRLRARGLEAVDGLEMLVGQAAVAFELFFGTAPPDDMDGRMRAMLVAA